MNLLLSLLIPSYGRRATCTYRRNDLRLFVCDRNNRGVCAHAFRLADSLVTLYIWVLVLYIIMFAVVVVVLRTECQYEVDLHSLPFYYMGHDSFHSNSSFLFILIDITYQGTYYYCVQSWVKGCLLIIIYDVGIIATGNGRSYSISCLMADML